MPHGAYEAWVRDVLGMKVRIAHYQLLAARWLDGKSATLADLPPTLLYALSAPTAPKELTLSVVAAAEAGEPLDAKAINVRLLDMKQEASELKAAQRRNPTVTREKLAADKAKQRQRWEAQRERDEREQARVRQEVEEQMQPLAAAILACPGDVAVLLSRALVDYRQRQALEALLNAGLREANP